MGINLQRLEHEIHEMLQLYKMPEGSDCTVSRSVAIAVDVNTWEMVEIYKEIPNNRGMGSNTRFLANLGEIARNVG